MNWNHPDPKDTIGLWRLNPTTGYWALARTCDVATAAAWLAVWQRDEPNVQFRLSHTKPAVPA